MNPNISGAHVVSRIHPSCRHWCGVVEMVPPKMKISSSEIDVELCSVRGGGMLELGFKSTICHL